MFSYNASCFRCYDRRLLISPEQVCDGVPDCYDLSDECLCEAYFNDKECVTLFAENNFECFGNDQMEFLDFSQNIIALNSNTNNSFIECQTKNESLITAIVCDGRPECKNYEDECTCTNPPYFCNDSCHDYFPMGDRYCDGVPDEAWRFISSTACPLGFDELKCPQRFECNAKEKVSIDVQNQCDMTADCDDESDETSCPMPFTSGRAFSNAFYMIESKPIEAAFWLSGFAVVFGNTYVIFTTITFLKKNKKINGIKFQHVIILNISIADFIMGIYLLVIGSFSAFYSGYYGEVDREWRSSIKCSIIGSLAVISSETSCFLMVVLTAFRLRNITNAMESLTSSWRAWKVSIGMAWLSAIIISFIPLLDATSEYFIHSFSFSTAFHNGTLNATSLRQFACRVAALHNTTILLQHNSNRFLSAKQFVNTKSNLPSNASVDFFGYYGATSICMPRFYVRYDEKSSEYTLSIITINFICFIFIALSYVIIWRISSESSNLLRKHKNKKKTARMSRRIARIVATDFCWIPICIMTYVSLGSIFSEDSFLLAYQISAVLLLPINSAINPFLFSSLPDKLIKFCRRTYDKMSNTSAE